MYHYSTNDHARLCKLSSASDMPTPDALGWLTGIINIAKYCGINPESVRYRIKRGHIYTLQPDGYRHVSNTEWLPRLDIV
ncbi:MAG: hypothetical protein RBR43_09785 [Desulfuromonadaceae bacterium]|nr:hypothetical protein [Desulfuromonadaceae bacterium]